MLGNITKKIFGSRNDRLIKQYNKVVDSINALEPAMQALDDAALKAKTEEFRQRLKNGETLDDLMVESFAVVREASQRVMHMRPYDVQLIGSMVLDEGKIAEMKTGEGKTLMSTLAVYLNALAGEGVHVVTVNEYLASRDAEWMGALYQWLGMSVGVIKSEMDPEDKKQAYNADITYGTNNEFGFDYLRDNMTLSREQRYQRGLNFAIIDEVDSILIDEARTPLIISGQASQSSDLYLVLNKVPPQLTRQEDEESPGDFYVDEKAKQVFLSEEGHDNAEDILVKAGLMQDGDSLYATENISLLHHLNASLRAHALYQKDVHYIVKNNQIVIVDEFTGRTMSGRRWSEGLHQAIEAKEGAEIQQENQTMASITFQNYFRMYDKLSGMTGTADTEAFELQQIYGLEVVVIPTNVDMVRDDMNDLIFLGQENKYRAIIKDVKYCQDKKRPVLVGTASIETSEILSQLLNKAGIKHEVLNAKQHEREATIIEEAGKPGAVTIATNMAGRGTDIVLGGSLDAEIRALGEDATEEQIKECRSKWQQYHQAVLDAGGLHIIGTERHESRRVDNQLRGRAGRQGDPGSSRFFISLEDNLMRIFASDKMRALMQRLGLEGDEAIENAMVTRSIENAQRKVEGHNFDIRKNLLEYDDVANEQRKVIYNQRDEILAADDIESVIEAMRNGVIEDTVLKYMPAGSIEEQWDIAGLEKQLRDDFALDVTVQQWLDDDYGMNGDEVVTKLQEIAAAKYKEKEQNYGTEAMREVEKGFMLQILDDHWKDHLAAMDYLRQSVGLRGYAQKNPKQEYKRESFEMFEHLLQTVRYNAISLFMRMELKRIEDMVEQGEQQHEETDMNFQHAEAESGLAPPAASRLQQGQKEVAQPFVRGDKKVGRNEPCPCGSGKKYKQCHGKLG